MPQKSEKIGQKVAQFQCPPAQKEKICRRSGKNRRHRKNPHLAVPQGDGEDKKCGGHQQPEQQVQHAPQRAPGHPDPQHTEDVVHYPDRHSQYQRPQHGRRLGRYGDLQPAPPSAEQPGEKSAPLPGAVLVLERVDIPLHL